MNPCSPGNNSLASIGILICERLSYKNEFIVYVMLLLITWSQMKYLY